MDRVSKILAYSHHLWEDFVSLTDQHSVTLISGTSPHYNVDKLYEAYHLPASRRSHDVTAGPSARHFLFTCRLGMQHPYFWQRDAEIMGVKRHTPLANRKIVHRCGAGDLA